MTRAPDETISHCYRHPDREALVRCTRCDRPICPDCMRPAAVGFHCPDDVTQAARTVRAPRTTVGARIMDSPPYATITFLVANVAVYLITGLAPGASLRNPSTPRSPSALFTNWELLPFAVHRFHRYYDLITASFLHVSPLHIGSNMLALIMIGPAVERLLGWQRFAALYLVSALGGSVAIYTFGDEFAATVGASGAIFGLFGACLVLARRLGFDLQWLIGIVVINFVLTFSIAGISKLGHVGGFVTGVLAALAIAGKPSRRTPVDDRMQSAGLMIVLGIAVLIVAVRTATFPT